MSLTELNCLSLPLSCHQQLLLHLLFSEKPDFAYLSMHVSLYLLTVILQCKKVNFRFFSKPTHNHVLFNDMSVSSVFQSEGVEPMNIIIYINFEKLLDQMIEPTLHVSS